MILEKSWLNLNTLPSKFSQYLVQGEMKREIDQLFKNGLTSISGHKSHIYETQNWIIKGPKNTSLNQDSHLYRIRKAAKINAYIKKHGYTEFFLIPKKYLYWNEEKKQFFVISQKIEFSKDSNRIISDLQAKVLAELSFEAHLTDHIIHNLEFTDDNRIVIFDTESNNRLTKKKIKTCCVSLFPFNKVSLNTTLEGLGTKILEKFSWLVVDETSMNISLGLFGTHNLASVCNNTKFAVVRKVNKKYALYCLSLLVSKIAVGVFILWCCSPIRDSLTSFPCTFLDGLRITLYTAAILKTYSLSLFIILTIGSWVESNNKLALDNR